MIKNFIKKIKTELKKRAIQENKIHYEKYFKGVIEFHGVKAPELKKIFKEIWKEIKQQKEEKILLLAFELMQSRYAEEKSIAIMIFHKQVKKLSLTNLNDFKNMIQQHIYDWATADSLSGKVIRHMIARDKRVAQELIQWKNAKNPWVQRVSTVSFVNLARHGNFNKEIIEICQTTIKNPDRFVQLGTGWVLRELYLSDAKLVIAFIKKNYDFFIREGLRYAIEKMEKSKRQEMLNYKKK